MNYSHIRVMLPMKVHESRADRPILKTAEDAHRVCIDACDLGQESFQVLSLDRKYRLINRHLVHLGIVDATLVHPREVFRPTIVDGAAAAIVVHNHPSGDPTSSAEDLRVTRQLVDAGRILGIEILDHVILGAKTGSESEKWASLRESGLVRFED